MGILKDGSKRDTLESADLVTVVSAETGVVTGGTGTHLALLPGSGPCRIRPSPHMQFASSSPGSRVSQFSQYPPSTLHMVPFGHELSSMIGTKHFEAAQLLLVCT